MACFWAYSSVHDNESSLYYLQSRYYDPQLGRFINADAFASTGQGLLGSNMFAYCNNNPVIFADQNGFSLHATTVRINDGGAGHARFSLPIPIPVAPEADGESLEENVGKLKDAITKSFARAKRTYDGEREDHHIVAENSTKAAPARAILEEVLTDGVNNPINHILIKKGLHKRIHRSIYYEDIVNATIVAAYQSAGGNKEQATVRVSAALYMLAVVISELDAVAPF